MAVPEDVITRWQGVSPYAVWAGAVVVAVMRVRARSLQTLPWQPPQQPPYGAPPGYSPPPNQGYSPPPNQG